MKRLTIKLNLFIALMFTLMNVHAQPPQGFNYQGIARDASGNPKANLSLDVELEIYSDPEAMDTVYAEEHQCMTNNFGLFTLIVGQGVPSHNPFSTIDWSSGDKYLRVIIDGTMESTTQLLSVPYALHAANGTQWGNVNNDIFYNEGRVIIGANNPPHPYPGNLLQLYSPNYESRLMIYGANGGSNYNDITMRDLNEAGWSMSHKSAGEIDHNLAFAYFDGIEQYTDALTISPSGKVGIGLNYLDNPQFKLHVKGNGLFGGDSTYFPYADSYQLVVDAQNTNKFGLGIFATDVVNQSGPISIISNYSGLNFGDGTQAGTTNGRMISFVREDVAANEATFTLGLTENHGFAVSRTPDYQTYQELFTILNNGNVGINKTVPEFPLHVWHITDPILKLERGNDGRSLILDMNSIRTNADHDLSLGVNGLAEDIYIDYPSHNVGIGTLYPSRKLDVNGAMHLTPQPSAPQNPTIGDMYYDGPLNKLRVYDGIKWRNCW